MTSTPTRFEPVWSSARWYAGRKNMPIPVDATLPDNTSASELASSERRRWLISREDFGGGIGDHVARPRSSLRSRPCHPRRGLRRAPGASMKSWLDERRESALMAELLTVDGMLDSFRLEQVCDPREPAGRPGVRVAMDTSLLNKKFARIGARLKVVEPPTRRRRSSVSVSLDIGADRRGEYFEITPDSKSDVEVEVEVLDVQPSDRHLLLLVREDAAKNKYLCGHDERHWFVAGIPETGSVGTVRQAMEALQPREVRNAVARKAVAGKARNRRKNAAFVRQGEWFFIPSDDIAVDESLVLKNEPLRRGNGGKPHWVDFCYRTGGETVYVCSRRPNGVTSAEYRRLLSGNGMAKNWGWQTMRRNPGVYVRGRVRHQDHATITLNGWHQVVMNTENQSQAMKNVTFLD